MARVFCVEWSEEDEALGAHEVGWSLHLTRDDAKSYIRRREAHHDGHGRPRVVEVPEPVYEEVRKRPSGVFTVSPCACPYRPARERASRKERGRDHEEVARRAM